MKPDYKNWMPQGMVYGTAAGAAGCLGLAALCKGTKLIKREPVKNAAAGVLLLGGTAAGGAALWMEGLRRAFSYDGKRQMSRQIIEGIADFVTLPEGGVGLDVGCGSGALTIACAKRNPQARFVGIDRWGPAYASFSKQVCEENARAEGVSNTEFRQGDAVKLTFADACFDAAPAGDVGAAAQRLDPASEHGLSDRFAAGNEKRNCIRKMPQGPIDPCGIACIQYQPHCAV